MTTRRKAKPLKDAALKDGFQNVTARLGVGAGSIADAATYVLGNPITRQPRNLEAMYRGSWIVGAAVDAIADDMTREGVDFGSAIDPDATEQLSGAMNDLQFWQSIGDVIRWARLYGGAIGVMLIDGQDLATPLRTETIGQGQFRGVLPLSRWDLMPTVTNVIDGHNAVTEFGPLLGKPDHYQVGPTAPALGMRSIHHTRVIRFEGIVLPYIQRLAEQGWGLSIVERMFDRLTAFDSATVGAAQLVYKAYLRTLKVEGLRSILAAGGPAEEALIKNVEGIRRFQTSEGLTLIDGKDELETQTYTFSGLDSILLQFGQQISGATEIPLVRLFGQSPVGLNSTGEGDIRNYYDSIKAKQERQLRSPLNRLLDVMHRSEFGTKAPDGFGFTFKPLWQLSEEQRADIAKATAETVGGAFDQGLISKPAALKELKQSADVTGIFSNISDQDITDAENEPPSMGELGLEAAAPNGVDPAPEGEGPEGGDEDAKVIKLAQRFAPRQQAAA